MSPTRRTWLNFAAGLSAAVCLAVLISRAALPPNHWQLKLWGSTTPGSTEWNVGSNGPFYMISRGQMPPAQVTFKEAPAGQDWKILTVKFPLPGLKIQWQNTYVRLPTGSDAWLPYATMATIHFRWLVAISLILPLIWTRTYLRERRIRNLQSQGRCSTCGYDLRATPTRCPECGAVA